MTIYRAKNFIEEYRFKALACDINELTGRTGRPDLTRHAITQIADRYNFSKKSRIADIGCGDALFLRLASARGVDGHRGRLVGILPTKEEIGRVRDFLLCDGHIEGKITVEMGMLEATNLPDADFDIVVSNSTFHYLGGVEHARKSLVEMCRILKPGGKIFIGELQSVDEMAGKDYGDSIVKWLVWVWKNQGARSFFRRLRQLVPAVFGSEPFITSPKKHFYMLPKDFVELMESCGFSDMECFPHNEMDASGSEYISPTRWDFMACKTSVFSKLISRS